jgi:hypothetical protein
MSERYDLLSPREGKDGKTFWNKVGAAFKREKGGYSIVLDAYPLPDKEGRVSMLMVPPKDKGLTDDQFKKVRQAAGENVQDEISDSIPF